MQQVPPISVVDSSALSGDKVLMPTEVFVVVSKFKRAGRLPNGSAIT
jgi:hypothetical protein